MNKKIIFNGQAGTETTASGIIVATTGDAVFKQALSDMRAGKGAAGNPAGLVEAIIARSETQISGNGVSLEIVRTTIITGAPQLPLTPAKIEVATEIPAGMSAAFSKALEKGSVSALDILLAGGPQANDKPQDKPAQKGLILPGGPQRAFRR